MSISVQIVTPERPIYSGSCNEVRAPSAMGEIGILPGHRALLAALDAGRVAIDATSGGSQQYAVSGGFIEVSNDSVTILAEHALSADEVEVTETRRVLAEAQDALRSLGPGDEAYAATQARVNWSRAQLKSKE